MRVSSINPVRPAAPVAGAVVSGLRPKAGWVCPRPALPPAPPRGAPATRLRLVARLARCGFSAGGAGGSQGAYHWRRVPARLLALPCCMACRAGVSCGADSVRPYRYLPVGGCGSTWRFPVLGCFHGSIQSAAPGRLPCGAGLSCCASSRLRRLAPVGLQSLTPSRRPGAARCACLLGDGCRHPPPRCAWRPPGLAGQGWCPDRLGKVRFDGPLRGRRRPVRAVRPRPFARQARSVSGSCRHGSRRHPLRCGGRACRTGSPVAARPTPARQARPCALRAPSLWSALRAAPFARGPGRRGRPGHCPRPPVPAAPQGGSPILSAWVSVPMVRFGAVAGCPRRQAPAIRSPSSLGVRVLPSREPAPSPALRRAGLSHGLPGRCAPYARASGPPLCVACAQPLVSATGCALRGWPRAAWRPPWALAPAHPPIRPPRGLPISLDVFVSQPRPLDHGDQHCTYAASGTDLISSRDCWSSVCCALLTVKRNCRL